MVGLTTAAAALPGHEQAAGFAVPVDETFRRVLETLKQGREVEYGLLGIAPQNLTPQAILAGQHGTLVAEVSPGTPAQRFGLLQNDIITHVNGHAIHNIDSLMLEVSKLEVDSMVKLTIERAGVVKTINLQLSKFPVQGKRVVTNPSAGWRGMRFDYATAKAHEGRLDGFVADETRAAVLVLSVEQDSPAWQEGLRPDMYVTHVDKTRVTSPKEFRAAVSGKTGPVALRLFSVGDTKPLIITIPAPAAAE